MAAGVAVGVADVVLLNPVDGLQEYVPPPPAVNTVDAPLQIVTLALVVAVGTVFTVITTVDVAVQPLPFVTVTVYVVVAAGVATGLEIIELLKEPDGDQEYVPPPLATNVVEEPLQILAADPALETGKALTVTVTVLEDEHPFTSVPTTVYVVVLVAEEVGVAVVEPVKEPAGLQTKPIPPDAPNVVVVPVQIETGLPALIAGNAFTFIVTKAVSLQPVPAVPITV